MTAPRGSAESRPGGAGDEAGSPTYRVRIADAQVEPPVVGVPPYFRVILRITSGDGQVHVVDIAGRSYRVAPGREEAVELPGLRPAQRLIGAVDGGRARLIVEASEGP